ncbi:hypothetical protein QFZ49_007321 [Streptomyces turgidiscabies]|uniref:Uncharacterized protein n=1 Tax=Streptomyces turgidiscabies TaxID=85558 RepID=A0ABU0RZD5_9ACTN|nr:hypothetical protein [Streptomyces turgidiscabies]
MIAALTKDVPLLVSAKLAGTVNVSDFVDDSYLKKAYADAAGDTTGTGNRYARATATTAPVSQPEVWLKGAATTSTFADPAALLRYVAAHSTAVRAAYVPDATTGTRWFADKSVWVQDGTDLEPFVTEAAADAWTAAHPGARTVSYATALRQAAAK